jgi:hypothetical protein
VKGVKKIGVRFGDWLLDRYKRREKTANTETGDGGNPSCHESNDCDPDIEESTDSLSHISPMRVQVN